MSPHRCIQSLPRHPRHFDSPRRRLSLQVVRNKGREGHHGPVWYHKNWWENNWDGTPFRTSTPSISLLLTTPLLSPPIPLPFYEMSQASAVCFGHVPERHKAQRYTAPSWVALPKQCWSATARHLPAPMTPSCTSLIGKGVWNRERDWWNLFLFEIRRISYIQHSSTTFWGLPVTLSPCHKSARVQPSNLHQPGKSISPNNMV